MLGQDPDSMLAKDPGNVARLVANRAVLLHRRWGIIVLWDRYRCSPGPKPQPCVTGQPGVTTRRKPKRSATSTSVIDHGARRCATPGASGSWARSPSQLRPG